MSQPPIAPGPPEQPYNLGQVMPGTSTARQWSTTVLVAVAGAAVIAGTIFGAGVALGTQSDNTAPAAAAPSRTPTPTLTSRSPSPSPSPTPAAPTTSYSPLPVPPPPPPTIEEGVWTVGLDVPPGKYRVSAALSGQCYWSITKSGTNGDDIIANDIPTGGRPQVTLKKGQDFETNDCGTWVKVG